MKPEKSSSMGWFSTERGQWSEDFGILGQFLGFHHSQHPKKQSITTSSIDLQPIPNQSPRTCKRKDHVGSVLLQVQLSSELLSSSLWCVVVVQWKHVVRVAAGFQGSPTGRCHPGVWAWKRKNQELKKKKTSKNHNQKHWNLRELRFKPQKCTVRLSVRFVLFALLFIRETQKDPAILSEFLWRRSPNVIGGFWSHAAPKLWTWKQGGRKTQGSLFNYILSMGWSKLLKWHSSKFFCWRSLLPLCDASILLRRPTLGPITGYIKIFVVSYKF